MDDEMCVVRRRAHPKADSNDGSVSFSKDGGDAVKDSIRGGNDPASDSQNSWPITPYSMASVLVILVITTLCYFHSKLRFLQCVTLLPMLLCLWRGITNRLWKNRLLPLTVVATTVFGQLPTFLGFAFAALCIVALSLNTLPSSQNHRPKGSPIPIFYAAITVISVLLTENFMVWVVSATFEPGQRRETAPPPLQDNGRTVIRILVSGLTKKEVVGLRRLWNVQGALVACLGASFGLAEIYGVRHLYKLGCRAVLTMAAARLVRTMSFLATVVPSQNQSCYAERFPYPPPSDWKEWIWVGLMPASHGGCNDLIISGHATVTSTLACIAASLSGDQFFSAALWTLVVLDYIVEIYEGFHYTVDMYLGAVLVCLFWRVLQPLEGDLQPAVENSKQSTMTSEPTSSSFFLSRNASMALYSFPALVAYLQLVLFPSWVANFLILFFTATVGVLFAIFLRTKDKMHSAMLQHIGQHILYCLLYMTLGIYL